MGIRGLRTAALSVLASAVALLGAPTAANAASADVIVRGAGAAAAVADVGGTVEFDLDIIDGVSASVPADRVAELRADPRTTWVELDAEVFLQSDPEGSREATSIYDEVVGATDLHAEGHDGSGVTVAVMDTGIAAVPDLADSLVGGVDFSGDDDPFLDRMGHGTFVAGLIAGDGTSSNGLHTGVAPGADLVSIKITGLDGSSDVSHVLAGIQWAVSFKDVYGIDVLTMSLGTDSTQPYQLSPLDFAVERAWDAGITVVVSASNKGPGAGTVTKPGDDPLVITVGALDDEGTVTKADDTMADFSGQGPTASDGLDKPDLVAPGRSVVSVRAPGSMIDTAFPQGRVDGDYFKGSGTSFSTPIVAGGIALLLDHEPGLTPNQIKHRLTSTATPGPVGDIHVDGHGSVDLYAAAHAGTFDEANVGVPRSLGIGSLDADRGSMQVEIEVPTGVVDGVLQTELVDLVGNLTAQNEQFDHNAFLTGDWTEASWYGSSWYGSSWYGSSWYGSSWYGSSWYGSSWYGSSWYGSSWYGSSWY